MSSPYKRKLQRKEAKKQVIERRKQKVMNESPLNGAYASGAGGKRYVSTAPYFRDLQNKIMAGYKKAESNYNEKQTKKDYAEKIRKDAKKVADGLMTETEFKLIYNKNNGFQNKTTLSNR